MVGEFKRVDFERRVEGDVVEIEDRVVRVCDIGVDVEFVVVRRSEREWR